MSEDADPGINIEGDKIIIPVEVQLSGTEFIKNTEEKIEELSRKSKNLFASGTAPLGRGAKMGLGSGHYAGLSPLSNTPYNPVGVTRLHPQGTTPALGGKKARPMYSGVAPYKSAINIDPISSSSASVPRSAYGGISPTTSPPPGAEFYEEGGGGFGKMISKGMGMGRSLLTGNIAGLTKMIPYIGSALIAIGFAELVIQKVYAAGGWLDIRWKRDIRTEFMGLWTRQQQQNRKVGVQGVIIASSGGFRAMNGVNVENTLRDVHVYGIESKVGYLEKRLGRRP